MARELKFRAWDAENNEMVYGVHLNDGKPVKPGYQWFSPQNTVHNADPMQYTGLKDKNGVDIYEGDILKVVEPMGNSTYSNGRYLGTKSWVNHSKHTVEFTPSGLQLVDYYTRMKICEVIGNRYENHELLEAK